MPVSYALELIDKDGNQLDYFEDVRGVQAARSFNSVGSCVITLPHFFNIDMIEWNSRMRLWRTGPDGNTHIFGDTLWLAQKRKTVPLEKQHVVTYVDANWILSTRLIAYTSKTPYADKTLEEFGLVTPDDSLRADNMIRAYVRENLGSGAIDTTRTISIITIEGDKNLGPYVQKSAAWNQLDSVINDLVNQSKNAGTPIFYDLDPSSSGQFIFRLWTTSRGVDRGIGSNHPLILSDEDRSLTNIEDEIDYSQTATSCYVLGYDQGPSQVYVKVRNEELIRRDPLNLVEFTVNLPDVDIESVLQDAGEAALQASRPRRIVTADVVDGTRYFYGTDYVYSDIVVMQVNGTQYNAVVDAVRVNWTGERTDSLSVRLTAEQFL